MKTKKIHVVSVSGTHLGFTSISKATDAVKLLAGAMFLERDWRGSDRLFRDVDKAKYSSLYEVRLELDQDYVAGPVPIEPEVVEPDHVVPGTRARRALGSSKALPAARPTLRLL